VWRAPPHAEPLVLRRVAGAHERPDIDVGGPQHRELAADSGERRGEVDVDVVGQRLQRRHIDNLRFVG
jgi:hypothetical protein